jgi:hypothetical protein
MRTRIPRAGLLAALVVLAAGCTKTLDTSNLQTTLTSKLQAELDAQDLSVHCPGSVKVKAGTTFTCTATDPQGQSFTILVTQTNDKGDVTWKLSGAATVSPQPTTSPTT